jgi:hypothetical protein
VSAVCIQCRRELPLEQMAVDRHRASGRKPYCKRCDSARSLARYYARRGEVPTRHCSECGVELAGRQRVVCSSRCSERRRKRTDPEAYAKREAAKVERRREARRRSATALRV